MNEIEMIAKSVDLAHKYCNKESFKRAVTIYKALADKGAYTQVIGLLQDLLKDTKCPKEEIESAIGSAGLATILRLTFDKNKPIDQKRYEDISNKHYWRAMTGELRQVRDDYVSYYAYIEDIVNSGDEVAFDAKRADILEHLSGQETLDYFRREKYNSILPLLKINK